MTVQPWCQGRFLQFSEPGRHHIRGNLKRTETQNHTRRAAGRAQGKLQRQAATFRLTQAKWTEKAWPFLPEHKHIGWWTGSWWQDGGYKLQLTTKFSLLSTFSSIPIVAGKHFPLVLKIALYALLSRLFTHATISECVVISPFLP